ncbi:MHYT domain-containing protein [Cryptosporangium aurantiacum]|uniref:MHYT domain-containing protein, NO-binding membrane sensor n=1 Tax=Cryptosporangium aurantiacum TaxID=134849 RepID=A0A1M7MYF0_9ACTN|nr:MHYT domain-containing protein [Cryptosporangium aurantiacum]SHM95679.1 MHYT domain-containing protein, NO-binding membrane sensor [Cryptosporangium aurantiacum]
MAHVHHFTYGLITLVLSYAVSVLGCLLGLICTARARETPRVAWRVRWLALGAVSIGGTGIWLMHFLAMLGFTVSNTFVFYDPALTALSALMAVGIVAVGIFVVGLGRPSMLKVLVGGVVTGLGVAGMHFTGMAAMRVLDGAVQYDPFLVALSVGIAVVAATVALWFTIVIKSRPALAAASPIMAIAVTGMHYTGMFAASVREVGGRGRVEGVDVTTLLVPSAVIVGTVLIALLYATLSAPAAEERAAEALMARLLRECDEQEPPPAARPTRATMRTQLRHTVALRDDAPAEPTPGSAFVPR